MMRKLGFDTIGNATIICFDCKPILVTDPWFNDEAYFGSWGHMHSIPAEQLQAAKACDFVWFSHGHPDHLNGASLPLFKGKRILLPDHVGSRIKQGLQEQHYDVQVMPDRKWLKLSNRVRALCISDYNQDAILLIDVGGRLLVNLNDAWDCGWRRTVRNIATRYSKSFLLALSGYGDADMINFLDESGNRIRPAAAKKFPLGRVIARKTAILGCRYFIPSSSMHRYQRSDSVWANEFTASLSDYSNGFDSPFAELMPAYISYDCGDDTFTAINPPLKEGIVHTPEDFGDKWSDMLERVDVDRAQRYFSSIEHLTTYLDFINLRVGGRDNVLSLRKKTFKRGITFHVPRRSLTTAIECEVFDDLLIGNFMTTTLHGRWPHSKLYPDFSPYVGKYADNGRAMTREQLETYFREYRKRDAFDYIRHRFEQQCKGVIRRYCSHGSRTFQTAKNLYWHFTR